VSDSASRRREWPHVPAVAACAGVAAIVVAADAWFASRAGFLSRPPEYDGVSYMVSAQQAFGMLATGHLRTWAHIANSTIAPLWTALVSVHYVAGGSGALQAFSSRFWPAALLLVLVYWVVEARAGRAFAIAAVIATALLPIVSAAVRAAPWELFTGQVNYDFEFGLDDLRPDFLTAVLMLWSVAAVAEYSAAPRRSAYVVSAVFAAAGVLMKQSTSPLVLAAWGLAILVAWFVNRREISVARLSLLSAAVLALLLAPWAILAGGVHRVVSYLYITEVTYSGAYGTSDTLAERLTYFAGQLPYQLGHAEWWVVALGAAALVVAMARHLLTAAEATYALVALALYTVLSLPTSRNSHLGIFISLSLWLFFWAGAARLAGSRWTVPPPRLSRGVVAAAAAYAVAVYGLGAYAVASWPASESNANAQKLAVTNAIAAELELRHVGAGQCFTYTPGPGWPAAIQFQMADREGRSPTATGTEVDLASTTISDYVAAAQNCTAFLVYAQPIAVVAQAFYAPPAYQPYFQAVGDWVKSPSSGCVLDRSWTFADLPPFGGHTLGRYDGVSLTLDLYLKTA
jgi:hypothetical protein